MTEFILLSQLDDMLKEEAGGFTTQERMDEFKEYLRENFGKDV